MPMTDIEVDLMISKAELSVLKTENEKLRTELKQIKLVNNLLIKKCKESGNCDDLLKKIDSYFTSSKK